MILSHDALNRERDWFESSQSLLYGGISDYENTEKAVRELLFTLIRETFLIGICWLTQMYTFLTDHFANHVKSALLDTKYSHLKNHIKFLSLVDLEYHTVTRRFIQNAVTAIKHARYAKMVYAAHNICGTLQNLVRSFSHINMSIGNQDNNADDDDDVNDDNTRTNSTSFGQAVFNIAKDAVPKLMTGVNPALAVASSVASNVGEFKNPLDLIYATGRFLTNNRNPQTVNYLPQTRDTVKELYTAVRGQLLHDITTNFFANLVLEIQQYKSISIENSLQNRLNRMSDKDIAHMANIEIDASREKVGIIDKNIIQLEQARDAIEDASALIDMKSMNGITSDRNNDEDDIKKRIRTTHEDTRRKRLRDIEKKLKMRERHKKMRKQKTTIRSENRYGSSDFVNSDKEVLVDSDSDDGISEERTSEVEDERELMRYNDKTSSETYLLGIFRKHDKDDLELGFLTGDSLEADVKFVERRSRQQQQRSFRAFASAANFHTTQRNLEQVLSYNGGTNSSFAQQEPDASETPSDNESDRKTVIDTSDGKKGL